MAAMRVMDVYRAVHVQGFLPIFVADDRDSKELVEACARAGLRCLEYTLRRQDAHEMIPWIRENYPGMYVLAGSTLDDDGLARQARERHPQVRTLDELAAMGVHGFVSMLGWDIANIRRFAATHLVAPSAMTVREAFLQLAAGAHFIKMPGTELDLVRRCRLDPTFGLCPVMATGMMTLERIPDAVDAGAVSIGSGFDLMLKGLPKDARVAQVAEVIRSYQECVLEARRRKWPELRQTLEGSDADWLKTLPHAHPQPDGTPE